jgi:hypothetical protein
MVSLEKLGTDSRGRIYAALETASRDDEVAVEKLVRKYGKDGTLLAEISDVPLDYFVAPLREFRLRGTSLYQLLPKRGDVQINVWDTASVQ